jgi:hypothetical protein
MNNPALTHGLDRKLPFRRCERHGESGEKKVSSFKLRNPLKSLDSDERIQGNPRKSNPSRTGPSQRNGHALKKPKSID